MIADIESAIKALGDYEFVIDGEVNSQSDWDNNVRFISGADENDLAIFTDTKPVTYAEVTVKLSELEVDAKWSLVRTTNPAQYRQYHPAVGKYRRDIASD